MQRYYRCASRRPNNKAQKYPSYVTFLLGLYLTCSSGCTSAPQLPDDPVPLSQATIDQLSAISRSAKSLGIELRKTRRGHTQLKNVHAVSIGAMATTSFVRESNAPTIHIYVGGKRVKALITTGLTLSVTDVNRAHELRATPIGPPMKPTRGQGALESYRTFLAVIRTMRIGGLNIYNVPIGILNDQRGLSPWFWLQNEHVDMLLGMNFLQTFSYASFDFGRASFKITHGRDYRARPDLLVVDTPFVPGQTVPVIEMFIGERGPFPTVVAMEQPVSLWIPRHLASMLGGKLSTSFDTETHETMHFGTLDIAIEDTILTGLKTVVSRSAEKDLSFPILGYKALSNYKVTLDFRAKKLILEDTD